MGLFLGKLDLTLNAMVVYGLYAAVAFVVLRSAWRWGRSRFATR